MVPEKSPLPFLLFRHAATCDSESRTDSGGGGRVARIRYAVRTESSPQQIQSQISHPLRSISAPSANQDIPILRGRSLLVSLLFSLYPIIPAEEPAHF